MKTTLLGPTGVRVSAIGLGAMPLSRVGRPPEEQAFAVIHRALDLGVTLIDTADAYSLDDRDMHHNEDLVRRALAAYEGDASGVRVATKGGFTRPNSCWIPKGDPDYLRRAVRESHHALGGEPIFLWQHHTPDEAVPVEDSLRPVREAVDEGLIRFVGVSNYTVDQIRRAREVVDVVSVQNQYSPWHRAPERDGVLAYCEREGLAFLPWSPLGGRHRAKHLSEYRGLAAVAEEKGVSPQRLVLAWLLAKASCVLPIPGARRVESVEDSVPAVDLTLTEDDVRRIDEDTA